MPNRPGVDSPESRPSSRQPFDERLTANIRAAFFEELAEVGYGRLSVESIVRRASTSKAAVYRRWPSKDAMALALIAEVAVHGVNLPETGALRSNLRQFLSSTVDAVRHPLARRIIPAIMAESQHNPQLAALLRDAVEGPRRGVAAEMLRRAIERGELPADCDVDQSLDFMIGPLYWRVVVRGVDLDPAGIERLTDGLLAAVTAMRMPGNIPGPERDI
ncbi:TetR/AcrR family transcriptional regulator [Micromonospora rifamycinica]|uniref:TetR/AcrR family transcriptional regulator n=1 Tax=Micromonospora rifamycinica TaxID=291594 RepID=UPI0033D541B8